MADELRVRPMREDELPAFIDHAARGFADAKVRAGDWSPQEALARAEESFRTLLPDGLASEGKLLRVAELADGTTVGTLLLSLSCPRGGDVGFIYDIEIAEDQRGRGYGRALLAAAGDEIASRGISTLELNVFGYNAVARSLYESAGYETVAVTMRRRLTTD